MRINREEFWDGYRAAFGRVTQKQVDAIESLLASFEMWSGDWNDPREIAYALATVKLETANTFEPIIERGKKSYFNQYDIAHNPRKAKALGNTNLGDGYLFRGRGFVQITGRANYAKFGIESNPERALNHSTAFDILTRGMHGGSFTGRKLRDYINGKTTDYKNARRVINGTDKAALIAGYAVKFEAILKASQVSAAAATDTPTKPKTPKNKTAPQTVGTEQPPIELPIIENPVIPVPTEAVAVATVTAEPQSPIDTTITLWSSRFVAIPAAVLTFLGGIGSWVTSSPLELTVTLVIAGCAVAAIYVIGRQIVTSLREAREAKIQREREDRAFQTQMALIQAASSKEANTVTLIAPPPVVELPNSDSEPVTDPENQV